MNAEPTQAYHFDGAAAEGEEGEEEEPMDCDATVAYRIEGTCNWFRSWFGHRYSLDVLFFFFLPADEDDNEDSPPSSPILVATKQLLPKEDTSKADSKSSSF